MKNIIKNKKIRIEFVENCLENKIRKQKTKGGLYILDERFEGHSLYLALVEKGLISGSPEELTPYIEKAERHFGKKVMEVKTSTNFSLKEAMEGVEQVVYQADKSQSDLVIMTAETLIASEWLIKAQKEELDLQRVLSYEGS